MLDPSLHVLLCEPLVRPDFTGAKSLIFCRLLLCPSCHRRYEYKDKDNGVDD